MTTEPRLCPITSQPLTDHQHAAPAASGRLRADMANLPDLMRELELAITRQVHMGSANTTRGERLPWNATAADAAWTARMTILVWTDHWARELGQPIPDTWPSIAAFLSRIADRLTTTPTGAQALDELLYATRICWHAIDRPPERVYAGPCPECGTDVTGPPRAVTAKCRECGREIDVEAALDTMYDALDGMILPVSWAAHAASMLTGIPVTPKQVNKWHERGKVLRRGHGRHGHTYRVGDITELARNTRRVG